MIPEKGTRSTRPILFICDKAPSSGAPHQHMAAIWLRHAGFEVRCICSGREGEQGEGEFQTPLGPVPATFLSPLDWEQPAIVKLWWHVVFAFRLLGARFRAAKGTLFYVQGHVSCPAACFALAGVARPRLLYHTQDYLEPGRHKVWALFEKAFARRAGTVICNEANRGRFMASSYRLEKAPATIPTSLPKVWIRGEAAAGGRAGLLRRLGLDEGKDYRLVLHQGPFVSGSRCGGQILDAFALLPKSYVLAFTGNSSAMWQRMAEDEVAERPALKGRVFFTASLPFGELLKETALYDMGILLYPNDGVGNFYQAPGRLTEYIGCGLPIVTSRFPGLELLVLKHGLGRTCDPDSPADIARAILELGGLEPGVLAGEHRRLRAVFEESLCYDRSAPLLERTVLEAGGPPKAAGSGTLP